MASSRALTGGTNDVNPQPLRCRVQCSQTSSAGYKSTAATVALPIPVQRLSTGGRAQVMEILKWNWDISLGNSAGVTISSAFCFATLSSRSNATTVPTMGNADPYCIDFLSIPMHDRATSATDLTFYKSGVRDLTDGAGHGVLFGMDTLYVQIGQLTFDSAGSTTNTATLNVNIWYRWKNVGFSEYVGMVTSA